jgi:small membrane protein
MILEIVASIFIVFAVSRVILRMKDHKLTFAELFFWLSVWACMIVVVFFPQVTEFFASLLGIGRGIDVIIYVSIALLFYLVFRLYIKIVELEREITLLVRELSLKNGKGRKNN